MGLTWILVAIAGLIGLAFCIVAVFARPMARQRRRLRPLANVRRLTDLPEYVRAVRLRTLAMIATIGLLVLAFAGAVITGARPTGLPSTAIDSTSGQPEDVMLCVGGPSSDPAVAAALRFFADEAATFDTQRIGLTAPNQRIVPLTRDYPYVANRFAALAQQGGGDLLVSPVSYSDYAGGIDDLIALCATGFPRFDRAGAQRRSVIYVGPGELRGSDERRPALFTADRVRALVTTAGIQVDAVTTGAGANGVDALVRDTGGQSFTADGDVAGQLRQIRSRPPAASALTSDRVATEAVESPALPVLVALAAALALAISAVVPRR